MWEMSRVLHKATCSKSAEERGGIVNDRGLGDKIMMRNEYLFEGGGRHQR